MKTTLYIVRHGQSHGNLHEKSDKSIDWNQWGELQSPLTPLGKKQAQRLAKKLENIQFKAFFSSDLNRARETAEILATKHKIQVQTESTIRERNFGKYLFSLSYEERKKLRQAVENLNDEELWIHKFSEDGESIMEAVDRFRLFIEKIIPLYKNNTILVVNHGNIMRMFLVYIKWAKFSNLPPGSIDNTGYFVLKTDGTKYFVEETNRIIKSD